MLHFGFTVTGITIITQSQMKNMDLVVMLAACNNINQNMKDIVHMNEGRNAHLFQNATYQTKDSEYEQRNKGFISSVKYDNKISEILMNLIN